MAQTIVRLPETVVNQIAAGEVIENPASIIKEMIENSLDAKARRIAISIQGGGQQLIEIEDDGCGMSSEDALLCLERHATSKIRTAEDLYSLITMGFRGEALAAIAAVSHFELKTSEGTVGTCVKCEGGKIVSTAPCARNRGTTISVRSLFFNVPARKKFLKSPSADTAQVTKIVETIALANPEVEFFLSVQCKAVLHFPVQDQKQRVEAVLGPFAHSLRLPSVQGYLSAPQEAQGHRRGQYLFVNKRPIFSPLIAKAVQTGYGTRLPAHHYPPFVLFLNLDPAAVDVNVHPQKREVRFADEKGLFRQIENGVAESFESHPVSFAEPLSFSETTPFPFRFAEEDFSRPVLLPEMTLPFEVEERPIAVLGGYLLLEKEGILLVDLAAAHARVLCEELGQRGAANQSLLWPLELTEDDPETAEALQEMGIECRMIGPKRLAIDALPSSMEPSHFFRFFSAWKEGKTLERATVHYCRSLGRRYSLDEAFLLWRKVGKCRDAMRDPLGRPIRVKLDAVDFEKLMEKR